MDIQQIRDRFKYWTENEDFKFDEPSHTYTLKGKKLKSVSSLVERFQGEFDQEEQLPKSAAKKGVSVDELRKQWAEDNKNACDLGHDVHYYIECDMNNVPAPDYEEEERLKRIEIYRQLKEQELKDLIPLFSELRLFDEEFGFAGTVDALYFDGKNIRMYDWKTNKKMTSDDSEDDMGRPTGRWRKMSWPFHDQWDNKVNGYSIQLSAYRYLLKRQGIDVDIARLYHIHSNGWDMYECKDYIPRLEQYFKHFL